MWLEGVNFDSVIYISVLNVCVRLGVIEYGKKFYM